MIAKKTRNIYENLKYETFYPGKLDDREYYRCYLDFLHGFFMYKYCNYVEDYFLDYLYKKENWHKKELKTKKILNYIKEHMRKTSEIYCTINCSHTHLTYITYYQSIHTDTHVLDPENPINYNCVGSLKEEADKLERMLPTTNEQKKADELRRRNLLKAFRKFEQSKRVEQSKLRKKGSQTLKERIRERDI